jgi:uncharacterized protein with WD repeat
MCVLTECTISSQVEQSKDGPVHDVQWSPEGDKYVTI